MLEASTIAFPNFAYYTRVKDSSVRVGLSYHFGNFGSPPAPVVAKY